MKPSIRKRLARIVLLLTLGLTFKANAQPHLCDDPCPPGPLLSEVISLCDATHPGPPPETGPSVFLTVFYRLRTCNNQTAIIIDDYVLVDNRNYLRSLGFNLNRCSYPNPMSTADLNLAVKQGIDGLLNKLGNPAQSEYEVYFRGSCYSRVHLTFPAGSFFLSTPDDRGKVDTLRLGSASVVITSIPCNDACCKIIFRLKIISLSNGETQSTFTPLSMEGDEEGCKAQELPDYDAYNPKLEAFTFDPVTKKLVPVQGTKVDQEPCELFCPRYLDPCPTTFSVLTDLHSLAADPELSASPTPFNDFISISSNQPISQTIVYDLNGRKVLSTASLEQGMLKTGDLKPGTYFVQVYFGDNGVKTIKVIKQ